MNLGYDRLQWLDLGIDSKKSPLRNEEEEDKDEEDNHKEEEEKGVIDNRKKWILPLYPLGAVYLPSPTTNQTIINIEPQNLQMAKDLLATGSSAVQEQEGETPPPPRLFCAVLRAIDTGRIAHIGTVLRILEAEQQQRGTNMNNDMTPPGGGGGEEEEEVTRIRLTCQAVETVHIDSILNPEAFGRERRLRKSSEYLKARVVRRPSLTEIDTMRELSEEFEDEIVLLINNFNMIKTIYQLEIGKKGFPPSMLFRLGNALTTWTVETFQTETSFWDACQEWQSVCYTIRQGKQAMLSANRNELMINSITGPLNLPIHLEDLEPTVRRKVEQMEIEAQKNYLDLQMDPCLDFQVLLSLTSYRERIHWLMHRVAAERQRLETLAIETSRARRL